MAKLGSTKKIPKTPKGEREETSKPLNPESGERGALMEKECENLLHTFTTKIQIKTGWKWNYYVV
jgi:hypothetical protein